MASVLSPTPHSPLGISHLGHDAAGRSCSSAASIGSSGTVQHHRLRSISTSSLSSVGSCFLPSRAFGRRTDSSGTPQSASSLNLTLGNSLGKLRNQFDRHSNTAAISRRSSLASALSGNGRLNCPPSSPPERRDSKLLDVVEGEDETARRSLDSVQPEDIPLPEIKSEFKIQLIDNSADETLVEPVYDLPSSSSSSPVKEPAFRRWLSTLRKKRHSQPQPLMQRTERWSLDDFDHKVPSPGKQRKVGHCKSDSQGSSVRFVTAVKSATATLASASIATVSKRATKWRRGQQRSSLISGSDPRPSVESQRSVSDEAAKERARKRRAKLEELIRTEESYVGDLKALSNAYFTILGHQPTSASFTRRSAQRTIAEILHLHDDILGNLHRAVPFAEYDQSTARVPPAIRTHNRWHSIDVVPTRTTPNRSVLATIRQGRRSLNLSSSAEEEPVVMTCSPQTVAAVTHIFASNVARFSAYEDYGANYDLVLQDIDETQRNISGWADFDKAIEAIEAHVNPTRTREANRKRAMTVKDLLIKPIQRIPRYELLFSDLSTLTPACDDPSSHAEIDNLRNVFNEKAKRMNAAKENPSHARTMETTWLIGDRLSFSTGQLPKTIFLQLLGPVSLCGCLHVAYRSRERIKGFYVISILFGGCLLLASADDETNRYSVLAGIALANATVEETDNGKGLQCHTAPHSWKVVFEQGDKMYELIFTACSAIEADAWRSYIASGIEAQTQLVADGKAHPIPLSSPLTLDMKSCGKAFGKPSSFVRCMPVRAATIGPTADLSQVIITNTQATKDAALMMEGKSSQTSLQIPRSQSMATPSHVQQLSPRRCERYRLETLLADVWTRDQLPYPGMPRRTDPLRNGANQVLRKFSMASITSNFSAMSGKRNGSYTSIGSWRKDELPMSKSRQSGRETTNSSISSRQSKRPTPQPTLVNFHTTPDAFLPADFELGGVGGGGKGKKRSALRTFTMTMERPFTPSTAAAGAENLRSGTVRRAESVRDAVVDAFSKPGWSPATVAAVEKVSVPVYSVVQERKEGRKEGSGETVVGVEGDGGRVRKSRSRLLGRFFG